MAVLKIKFNKNAKANELYILREGDNSLLVHAEGVIPGKAAEQFIRTAQMQNSETKNQAIHIIQSWGEEDGCLYKPEDFHQMGKKLAESYFKGHEYLVVTHTNTKNIHNHLLINPVSLETGKRVHNKIKHLKELQKINDKISKEHGLSVVEKKNKEKEVHLPYKAKQANKFRGNSYLLDLIQKANISRSLSTSFDEYSYHLHEWFGIKVRIEDKNITYFYPGKERGKRGAKIGKLYDKDGLIEVFKKNDQDFTLNPHLRVHKENLLQQIHELKNGPLLVRENVPFLGLKNYEQFTRTPRRTSSKGYPSDQFSSNALIPHEFIKAAKEVSLFDYCKSKNIKLVSDKNQNMVMYTHKHIKVTEKEWINNKNQTRGNIIDFVATCENISFIKTISHLTNNPRIALLEAHLPNLEKRSYRSFLLPQERLTTRDNSRKTLEDLFKQKGGKPNLADNFLNNQKAQVSKEGVVRIFSLSEESYAYDYVKDEQGTWHHKKIGHNKGNFFTHKGKSKKAYLFSDPFSLTFALEKSLFSKNKGIHGILALFEPDGELVDKFLNENLHIQKLVFVPPRNLKKDKIFENFFNISKERYRPFGISLESKPLDHSLKENSINLDI